MQTYPPGTRIGQYEIASRPMMGGMGVVYFALDHGNDGRPVALKTFRPELLPDRAARDRFLREGTAWVELGNHPHIVRCYKVEYIDPTAFLVLELIAKEQNMPDASLRSWLIPGHSLPIEQALLFALQIARGMQYATEKIPGFVHRDLKPENVLVGAEKLPGININRLRITDFGLVGTLIGSNITDLTVTDEYSVQQRLLTFMDGFVGTPEYASPEQFAIQGLDERSDHYAFGCIFYEMLTGQAPFRHISQTRKERFMRYKNSHMNEAVKPLKSIISTITDNVEEITMRCLTKKLNDRYENWIQLEAALSCAYQSVSGKESLHAVNNKEQSHNEQIQDGRSYNAIGAAFLDMGDAEKSIVYFEKSLGVAKKFSDREWEGKNLGNLGLVHSRFGIAEKAIAYYEQALEIAHELGDGSGEVADQGNLGIIYAKLGETQKAIHCFEQQMKVARGIDDQRGIGNALGNLGNVYILLGDLKKASEYHERSLVLHREIGDRREESNDLGNLGVVYKNLGDLESAIKCYKQCLTIHREIGDRRGEGNSLGNLGVAYKNLGDWQKAIEYYEQCLAVHREIKDIHGEATDYYNIAMLYTKLGESSRALPLAQESARIFAQINSPNVQHAHKLIAHLKGKQSGFLGRLFGKKG